MDTNHEMSYYNYGKTLSAEGVVKSWLLNNKGNDNHEYVDLGLPSGTLWATTNIQDADGNELYFAWGETQGYTSGQVGTDKYFSWGKNADYKYGMEDNLTKYNNTDKKTELDSEDDSATANLVSNWRSPTIEQFDELIANTEYEWTIVNGVQGAKFTSTDSKTSTDKFLFFPAVGGAGSGQVLDVGNVGLYWAVSLFTDINASRLYIGEDDCLVQYNERYYGFSVRPVRSKKL